MPTSITPFENPATPRTRKGGDWMWLNKSLLRSHMRQLGPYGLQVYSVLAMHVDEATQRCLVKQRTIAELVGCSLRSVLYALELLESRGLIRIESGKAKGKPDAYILLAVESTSEVRTAVRRGTHSQTYPVRTAVHTPSTKYLTRISEQEGLNEKRARENANHNGTGGHQCPTSDSATRTISPSWR